MCYNSNQFKEGYIMIKLSNINIDALEKFDSGDFGTLYKNKDVLYKIYNPEIFVKKLWKTFDNPCYNARPYKYKRLVKRCSKLKNTDIIYDYIADEDGVKGVALRRYRAKSLDKVFNLPLYKRVTISRQLLAKDKELKRHLIYVDDYKVDNVLYTYEDEVQIADLDDVKTHVCHIPNPLLNAYSNYNLAMTIMTFLGELKRYPTPLRAEMSLDRKRLILPVTHAQIHSYINAIEKKKDFLYIDSKSDINRIKEVLSTHDFKLVYLLDSESTSDEIFKSIVRDNKRKEIKLYDFLYRGNLDKHDHIESINEGYAFKDKDLVRVYKK
jgi:hypothetical protein